MELHHFGYLMFCCVFILAMIINKSQVQSLKNVGIYLPSLLFSSDKFYVAISRVISRNGLKILITDEDD